MSRKFKFHSNLTRISGTFHEGICTFMPVSRSILLRERNVEAIAVEENKTHVLCSVNHCFAKIIPFMREYVKMW